MHQGGVFHDAHATDLTTRKFSKPVFAAGHSVGTIRGSHYELNSKTTMRAGQEEIEKGFSAVHGWRWAQRVPFFRLSAMQIGRRR